MVILYHRLYTWAAEIPDQAKSLGFNVLPMLWGSAQAQDFQRLAKPGYASIALGMNEYV